MKRTRAQNPKVQDQEPQDPAAAGSNPNPKPQRRAKQPRQPKAATAGKKTAAAREAAAAAATAAAAAAVASPAAEMAPVVPAVCVGAGGGAEVACGLPADWDEMDVANGSPWWTFGVEEDKLLGWFPFVEEDFLSVGGVGPAAEAAAFDDDIWRIYQIYEIPSYAAK